MGSVNIRGQAGVMQGHVKITSLQYLTTFNGEMLSFSTSAPAWIDPNVLEFSVNFADIASRDQFFSLGGQTRIDLVHENFVLTGQNSSMSQLLDAIGLVIFGNSSTTNTANHGTGLIGYTSLTASYQNIFTAGTFTGSPYVSDAVSIEARLDGNNVRFRITISEGPDNTFDAPVTGDLLVKVDERRYYTEVSPTYTVI